MPITIDGVKYMVKEIEGTDIDAIRKFCVKNKCKSAVILYIDKDNTVQGSYVWFTKKGKDILDKVLRRDHNVIIN